MIYFTLLQLKVYARALTVRESWSERDYKYKGYSATRAFEVLIFLYSIYFAVFGLITILLVHVVPEWYGNTTARVERGKQWYSFFWALFFVAFLCNAAVITCEIYAAVRAHYNIIVIPLLVVSTLFDLLIAGSIRKDPAFPIPKILTFFCSCCHCSPTSQSKLAQTLALWNFLMLVHFATISALPTLLWMFVLPVQILAVTALLVASIFFATTLIAHVIKHTPMLHRRKTCRENCRVFLPVVGVGLFLALVILASAFYIKLINTGVDPNNLGKFIASFFPSATLTITGWFVTKGRLFDKLLKPTSESNRNTSTAVTSACEFNIRRAEEGLVEQKGETRSNKDTIFLESESTPLLPN